MVDPCLMSYSCVFLIGRNIAYTLVVGIIIDIAKEKRTWMGKTEKKRCVEPSAYILILHTYWLDFCLYNA